MVSTSEVQFKMNLYMMGEAYHKRWIELYQEKDPTFTFSAWEDLNPETRSATIQCLFAALSVTQPMPNVTDSYVTQLWGDLGFNNVTALVPKDAPKTGSFAHMLGVLVRHALTL